MRNFEDTEIGPIPVGWELVPVRRVGTVVTGKTPATKEPRYWNGSIPFITPGDLQGRPIRMAARTISQEGLEAAKPLPNGTVLVSCIGYIGKVGVVEGPVAVTNQQIDAVVVDEKLAFSRFLAYAFLHLRPQLSELARVTTVPILNKSNFESVPIPLPPLPEQQRIAGVLSTVQRAIEATEAVIAAMRELSTASCATLPICSHSPRSSVPR